MRVKDFVPEFKVLYSGEIRNYLKKSLDLSNDLQIPKILKVVVNSGFGSDQSLSSKAIDVVQRISCQCPVVLKAKKSIAEFKIREGNEIGVKSTCRGDTMYIVLQRVWLALLNGSGRVPQLKVSSVVVGCGTCSITIGFKDSSLFDGVVVESGVNVGCNITIVASALGKDHFVRMLSAFGFPFENVPYKYEMWRGA